MIKKILNIFSKLLVVSIFISCQQNPTSKVKRRNVDDYFFTTGIAQYFLADLPSWANFSESGKCHRDGPIRFLHLEKIKNSFALDYEEAIQFQYMLNKSFQDLKIKTKSLSLSLKDEEVIFHETMEKIQAKIRPFIIPKYPEINLVWIDSSINDQKILKNLKKYLNSVNVKSRPTILISFCLTYRGMENHIKKNNLGVNTSDFISGEMFNPYLQNKNPFKGLYLQINKLFKNNKKIYLYVPKLSKGHDNAAPGGLIGDFSILTY